jgi:aminomethyltransferase
MSAKLALDAWHRSLGARMGPFAGYDMPIEYPSGLKTEHLHTRAQAGLFDVSHMGQVRVTAQDRSHATLARALEAALPVDFDGWPAGLQKYSFLLNDRGGIADDLMLVNLQGEARMVLNAANAARDLERLQALCSGLRFERLPDALIALQGPEAEAVLAAHDAAAAALKFMHCATLKVCEVETFVTRSGYTGEDGYEISIPAPHAERVVRALLEDPRVKPAGLGARDTLRLEAGLPLHGNDIDADKTPVEAGLAFAIPASRRGGGSKARGFPGAATVLAQLERGVERRLVGLSSAQPVPIRAHAALFRGDRQVGEVTSGTVSPTLGRPIMLAYVQAADASGAELHAGLHAVVRGRHLPVAVTRLPFVPKRYRR